MTDERLIEARAALKRYEGRHEAGTPFSQHAEDVATALRGLLVVFEKAHTPTDDEREAQRIAHLDARQAAYQQDSVDWYVDHEAEPGITSNAFFRGWDAAVGGGFRRSEVPEPSAECPKCGVRVTDQTPSTFYTHHDESCGGPLSERPASAGVVGQEGESRGSDR